MQMHSLLSDSGWLLVRPLWVAGLYLVWHNLLFFTEQDGNQDFHFKIPHYILRISKCQCKGNVGGVHSSKIILYALLLGTPLPLINH